MRGIGSTRRILRKITPAFRLLHAQPFTLLMPRGGRRSASPLPALFSFHPQASSKRPAAPARFPGKEAGRRKYFYFPKDRILARLLRPGGKQCPSGLAALVFSEVFHKSPREVERLFLPLGGIPVGISRIQNPGIHPRKGRRNLKIEVGNPLRLRLQDLPVQDRIDDSPGILFPEPFQPVFTR